MRVVRLIATAFIVVGLIVATPAAASAAVPFSAGVATADTPDFTPSGSKWRAWMVNLLSSVMGAATPSPYRAEQLANQYRYNHSWEQFNAQHGISGIRYDSAGNMVGVRRNPMGDIGSGTLDDVVIDQMEDQWKARSEANYRNTTGTGGGLRAPATAAQKFGKSVLVGGVAVASALTAYELGASFVGAPISGLVGSWFGYDANGLVCGADGFDSDAQQWVFRAMSGQDCSAFDIANEYPVNQDADHQLIMTLAGTEYQARNASVLPSYCGSPTSCVFHGVWGSAPTPAGYTFVFSRNGGAYGALQMGAPPAGGLVATRMATVFGSAPNRAYEYQAITGTFAYGVRQNSTGVVTPATQVADDPEREVICDVEYTDGTSASGSSVPYRESDGALAQPACPNTPDGKTPESVSVRDTGQPIGAEPLYEEEVTPEYQEWWESYPECRTGSCKLDLIRLAPLPAVSCFDVQDGCLDWHTDPDKTENYLCRYGVHDVDLAECNVYAGLFQPGRITTGSPYSDPETGHWSGGQNAPKPGGQAMNVAIQDPENPRSCNFPDFALDPVSWVLTPVNCSMERNFVPRQTVVETHFAAAAEAWEGKPPQVIASAVESMALAPGATGCSRSVTLFGSTFPVIDACSGVGADIAFWSRMITSAAMVILVLVVVKRQIAGMVGYNQGQG